MRGSKSEAETNANYNKASQRLCSQRKKRSAEEVDTSEKKHKHCRAGTSNASYETHSHMTMTLALHKEWGSRDEQETESGKKIRGGNKRKLHVNETRTAPSANNNIMEPKHKHKQLTKQSFRSAHGRDNVRILVLVEVLPRLQTEHR